MASTAKQQSGGSQEPPMFLDILTKEEKEALLNKKMEEIRRKNEALKKRHEEIEADKKAAQQMGRLVDPRQQVSITPNKKPDAPREIQKEANRNMRGVREEKGEERRSGKLAAGRAKRLANMSKEKLKANPQYIQGHDQEKGDVSPSSVFPNQPQLGPGRRRGGSGRTGSQIEPRSPDSENGPPPDPAFNFLSDRSREGPLPEKIREQKNVTRHPRNFGGTSFNNVQQKIKTEKEYQGRQGGPPRSKMEMAMKMTGRERREYSEWKSERERIDQARIDRQLSHQGDWRREWDHDKVEQDFDSGPSESGERRTEPGRRPAGRIGSGRFDRGDSLEERKRGDGPGITVIGYAVDGQIVRLGDQIDEDTFKNDPDSLENTLESLADYERDSRGQRDQGRRGGRSGSRGRGGRPMSGNYERPTSGNYDRHRASSTGSDETSRSVEEQNDSLIVKIDNEFASTNRRLKRSPSDDKSKRRSFDESSHESGYSGNERERPFSQRGYNRERQENGENMRGSGGNRRGTHRPERARRNLYRGGDDGVRCDGFREPPRGRANAAGRNRVRRAGSGRIPDDRYYREGDSNLAEVEPSIAMGTFDENWDYGDLQPGQVVQIVSADLNDKDICLEALAVEEEGMKSPDDGEEWEDAHDFYDVKMVDLDDEDDGEEQDPHNSSAESLERFIQEHTLKLDVNVGSMVPPLSPLSDPASPDSVELKRHPLSAAKIMDWGASENFSDNKSSNASGSLNTSRNAEDMTDLPENIENESLEVVDGAEMEPGTKADIPQDSEFKETPENIPLPEDDSDTEEKKPKDNDIEVVDLEKNEVEAEGRCTEVGTSNDSSGLEGTTDTEKAEKLSEPTAENTPSPSAVTASTLPSSEKPPLSETNQLEEAESNESQSILKEASSVETASSVEPEAEKQVENDKKEEKHCESVVDSAVTEVPTEIENNGQCQEEEGKLLVHTEVLAAAPEAAAADNHDNKDSTAEKPQESQTSKGEAEPVASPGASTEDASASKQG